MPLAIHSGEELPPLPLQEMAAIDSYKERLYFLEGWFETHGQDPSEAENSAYWRECIREKITRAPQEHFRGNMATVFFKYLQRYYQQPNPFDMKRVSPPSQSRVLELINKARRDGHEVALEYLVRKKLRVRQFYSELPFLETLKAGYDSAALAMLNKYSFFLRNRNLVKKCLLAGAERDCKKTVEEILRKMQFDLATFFKPATKTPLHNAARAGHIDMIKIFVTAGIDINIEDGWGEVPLTLAIKGDFIEAVRTLIHLGANVNARNSESQCYPLHIAAWGGAPQVPAGTAENQIELIKLLLDAGALVNVQEYNKRTPLHMAVKYGQLKVIQLLLEAGADLEIKDQEGQTPLALAKRANQNAIVQILLQEVSNREGQPAASSSQGKVRRREDQDHSPSKRQK